VARCLAILLRYELAAVHAYRFAEAVSALRSDRECLAAIRRGHESAARALREYAAHLNETDVTEAGLWGVMNTLVETAAAFGRRSMLTVLLWSERHAAQTYESAARIPALGPVADVVIPGEVLPAMAGHVEILQRLLAGLGDDGRTEEYEHTAPGSLQTVG
jgi:hypothetical protein